MNGWQEPRIASVPASVGSSGPEAVELAAAAGLRLDPWEERVLVDALGRGEDGKWAAFEIGLLVPRQNGKSAILEARELAGLFVLGEELIIHSAHEFKTSREAFRRLVARIEGTPQLACQVGRIMRSHGEEGVELVDGRRILFVTRTKVGGRGFAGDLIVYDEAMILAEEAVAATLPIVSSRSMHGNPQVWYAGSAVDRLVHERGSVLARVRERGHSGDDPSLAYFEWGLDAASPDDLEPEVASNPDRWAEANPALGIRISLAHVANEQRSMDSRTFAVERLGVGDWPSSDAPASVLDLERWLELTDPASTIVGERALAFDVTPDRSYASIAAAGRRADGLTHVEVVDHRRGAGWVVARLVELAGAAQPVAVVCDATGPAGSLIPGLEQAGVEVHTASASDQARACGLLFDVVEDASLRHHGTQELTAAVRGAARRPLGDAWAWSRRSSTVDISPLVAVTLAVWGTTSIAPEVAPWLGAW